MTGYRLGCAYATLKDKHKTREGFRHLVSTKHLFDTFGRKRLLNFFGVVQRKAGAGTGFEAYGPASLPDASRPPQSRGVLGIGRGLFSIPPRTQTQTLSSSKHFSCWQACHWGALYPIRVPPWPIHLCANQCPFERQCTAVMLSDKAKSL